MEVGRVVLRPGFNGAVAAFGTFINIPNLQLDGDEFVFLRVESVDEIPIQNAGFTKTNCINLVADIPQYPSYDSGTNTATSACGRGQCRQLLQLHRTVNFQGGVSSTYYGVYRYPRVPIKTRINLLQGKYIRMGLEYNDGTPIPASAVQPYSDPQIVLVFYK
jgi:hypothetical protein